MRRTKCLDKPERRTIPFLPLWSVKEENAQKVANLSSPSSPCSLQWIGKPHRKHEQTFDCFPEFDEAQSLSWKVVYGKIVKDRSPKKTKIGQIKREIETSKEFINALKKATDKHPKCLVKPSISMQKKGDASAYKGAFCICRRPRPLLKPSPLSPGGMERSMSAVLQARGVFTPRVKTSPCWMRSGRVSTRPCPAFPIR